jgi:E-phenylitaconyl-CoA hydratase
MPYAAGTIGIAQAALQIAIDWAQAARDLPQQAGRQAGHPVDDRRQRDGAARGAAAGGRRPGSPIPAAVATSRWTRRSPRSTATETAGRVVDRCIQIFGGMGVSRELPLERWYRELRIKRIGEGPSEVHRMVLARHLLGTGQTRTKGTAMSIDLRSARRRHRRHHAQPARARNALDAEHYQALSDAWTRVRDDDAIRVAIVTGAGERFQRRRRPQVLDRPRAPLGGAVADAEGPAAQPRPGDLEAGDRAVNGHCLAGGMTLLLATDIRVAAEHATFGSAEVKRGIIAGNGGTQRMLEQLPHAIAMEMLLTGDAIDAATAARWGLVNKVVPAAQLMDEALCYARRIAANAPLAVQAAKELAVRSASKAWPPACASSSSCRTSCARPPTPPKAVPPSPRSARRDSRGNDMRPTKGRSAPSEPPR